jgi:hypothetical protein
MCLPPCTHPQAGALAAPWCKIRALRDALDAEPAPDTLLFLDSDAVWVEPNASLSALVDAFVWPGEWHATALWFGCNLPFKSEARGRRQWIALAGNGGGGGGDRGPPNTGVILLRNVDAARQALAAWWDAPVSLPAWNRRFAWEQSALWELWRQPNFSASMRVLHNRTSGECLRTMDRAQHSLIAHVPGGGTKSRDAEERRLRFLRAVARLYGEN